MSATTDVGLGVAVRLQLWADIKDDKLSEDRWRQRIATSAGPERTSAERGLAAVEADERDLWDALATAQGL